MLLGELWWAQSAGAIPGNPLRAFVSVAIAMFLDASGFHAGSFAPASSSRKVHPVYRLLKIVDEPVVSVFVANAKFDLNGAGFADDFFGAVAVLEIERRLVFRKILVRLRSASFEEGNLQASFRKTLAGPASGSSGTDNDDIIGMVFLLTHRVKIRRAC